MGAQQAAFDSEMIGARMRDTFLLWKKYPLGVAPYILLAIFVAWVGFYFQSLALGSVVSLTTTAVASTILIGLIFAFYVTYRRANERWMEFAKGHIGYIFKWLLLVLFAHCMYAYQLFGFRSSTFVTFAILTVLVVAISTAFPNPEER
jgi:hypothetical protein